MPPASACTTLTPFSALYCAACDTCTVGEFCLLRCHNIDVARLTSADRDQWVCPACYSLCYCAACQRYEKHRAAERLINHSTVAAASIVREVIEPATNTVASVSHIPRAFHSLHVDTSPSSASRLGTSSFFHSSPLTPLAALDYSLPATPTAPFNPPAPPVPPPRPSHSLLALARTTPRRPTPLQLPVSSPAAIRAAAPLFSPVGLPDSGVGRAAECDSPFVPLLISRSSPHPFFTFPAIFPAPQLFSAPPHCSSSRTYSWGEIPVQG